MVMVVKEGSERHSWNRHCAGHRYRMYVAEEREVEGSQTVCQQGVVNKGRGKKNSA